MKDIIIDKLQKLSECLSPGCDKCSEIHPRSADAKEERCCEPVFCASAKLHFLALGQSYDELSVEERVKPNIPFLKKGSGCIIAPEHRPYCTMYACPGVLHHDRKLRREYNRLHDKLKVEPEILELGKLHQDAIKTVLEKGTQWLPTQR
jgi:hypothetical protein